MVSVHPTNSREEDGTASFSRPWQTFSLCALNNSDAEPQGLNGNGRPAIGAAVCL
jgi:hypothetical protein